MEKMKIYLQRPWRWADSSYYKNLVTFPPEGVKYLNAKEEKELIQSTLGLRLNNYVKQNIKKVIQKIYPSMPNSHLTRNSRECDLIHCAHCLSANKNKSWVFDIEYIGQLWAAPRKYGSYPDKRKVRKILLKKNCKKILAWTKWVKNDLIKLFPEIKDKIDIVTFAMPSPKSKKKKSKKIRLLFSARRFYFKGGLYAIEVIDRLTKKYENVEGIIVSDTPKEIIEKYGMNKAIEFYGLMNQKELFEKIYPESDIFIYPSFTDSFGFGFVEAMAFGLPVVGIEGHCNKEIIDEGKTGFIIPRKGNLDFYYIRSSGEEVIKQLLEKVEMLVGNEKLRKIMGERGIREIKGGRFSIKRRNKKLKQIYEEVING